MCYAAKTARSETSCGTLLSVTSDHVNELALYRVSALAPAQPASELEPGRSSGMQVRMTQLLQMYDDAMSSSHTRVTIERELGESVSAIDDHETRTRMLELRSEANKQV